MKCLGYGQLVCTGLMTAGLAVQMVTLRTMVQKLHEMQKPEERGLTPRKLQKMIDICLCVFLWCFVFLSCFLSFSLDFAREVFPKIPSNYPWKHPKFFPCRCSLCRPRGGKPQGPVSWKPCRSLVRSGGTNFHVHVVIASLTIT